MDGLAARLAPLWRPHPSIPEGAAQRRAKLASGLLLVLLPLLLLALLFPDETDGPFLSGHRLTLLAFVGLAASFALVRGGRVLAGVILAIATIEVALAISVSNADDHTTAILVLGFLVVPIAMAGILLPARGAALVGALTLALAFALESIQEGESVLSPPDQHALTLALQLVAVSMLAVVSATMVERQARDLEGSRQLLRQVTDNIPEIFFVIAADGSRVLYMNRAYETVMGRALAQGMSDPQDWLKGVHPDDLPGVMRGLAARTPELSYRIVHPTQGVKHLRARTFLAQDGTNVIVGIAEDVTAAVKSESALKEAQRQRIHLMQQLAHDMASPLTPIKLQLRLLKDAPDGQGAKGLDIIRRNTEHLERLVADVRDVAKLEGGDLKVFRKPVDVAELARQAVESLAPSAADRQVRLVAEVPGAAPLEADAGRVTQILYNLIGNALKFTPPGGQVTVGITKTDRDVEVEVRDTGNGMAPEQLSRLFKPFSQVHDPTALKRPEDKGTGLGLYISKGLVEAHGGAITVASDGPGRGSTFTFRLPVA
jgi:signal transduction histidine kinase